MPRPRNGGDPGAPARTHPAGSSRRVSNLQRLRLRGRRAGRRGRSLAGPPPGRASWAPRARSGAWTGRGGSRRACVPDADWARRPCSPQSHGKWTRNWCEWWLLASSGCRGSVPPVAARPRAQPPASLCHTPQFNKVTSDSHPILLRIFSLLLLSCHTSLLDSKFLDPHLYLSKSSLSVKVVCTSHIFNKSSLLENIFLE